MSEETMENAILNQRLSADDDHRLLTEAGLQSIFERVVAFRESNEAVSVTISAWWSGSLRWARNRVNLASDQRDVEIAIQSGGSNVSIVVNQTDDTSLRAAVHAAERQAKLGAYARKAGGTARFSRSWINPPLPYPETSIWSDATYRVTPEQRAILGQALTDGAESEQLLSAGLLEMQVYEGHRFLYSNRAGPIQSTEPPQGSGATRTARDKQYVQYTQAQCSMTVRHPTGQGSGWAGLSSYDWSAIDGAVLAERALDKCVAALNPVAIEPGRYTVILEPQAVVPFARGLVDQREDNEEIRRPGKYSLDVDPSLGMRMTKLGLQIIDERISVLSDPMDPRLGKVPELGMGPVTHIEHGVLKSMGYDRGYAIKELRQNLPRIGGGLMMTGGDTSMDEMIATTKRGVIVTRFSNVVYVPGSKLSLVMTGFTRDGLWLVENGKISKAVRNMRFTDSPFFVFNQVEQLGPPVPVFSPTRVGSGNLAPIIVPPVKSRDFAFTATVEAI